MRPHEFRQVLVACDAQGAQRWTCGSAQAARHVFVRRRERSAAVQGDIATADAPRLLEFAERVDEWRRIDPVCASLSREGDRYVLQELEVRLEFSLENDEVRLLHAEQWIL